MKSFGLALVAVLLPAAASAQSMNAEVFYQRAAKLQKKGPLALFSGGEIKVLMREGNAAGEKAADQARSDAAAGRKPRFCPPQPKGSMGNDEFMRGLTAIPAADRRRIDMTEATTRILARKYPCRG